MTESIYDSDMYRTIVSKFRETLTEGDKEDCEAWANLYMLTRTVRKKSIIEALIVLFADLPRDYFKPMVTHLIHNTTTEATVSLPDDPDVLENNVRDLIARIRDGGVKFTLRHRTSRSSCF